MNNRGQVHDSVREHIARAEITTGVIIQSISLDGAGEHKGEIDSILKRIEGITLERSPPYDSKSNGKAERLMQELSLKSRVMMINTGLTDSLWAEAMKHGNWLRNRLPSKHIGNKPLNIIWKPNAKIIELSKLPTFGKPGFAFIYRPSTEPNKKLSACSIHVCFVRMESDGNICRTYNPVLNSI